MALFPPGKGGGEDVAVGFKGKGVLIHSFVAADGMPLSALTTAANASERAQVVPLLDAVRVRTGKPGRPRKRVGVLVCDKGYDSKEVRRDVRRRGIRAQIPKRVWPTRAKPKGRPIKEDVPRYQVERTFSWFQRKYRRLVVRWERIKACFDGFLSLAFVHIWINRILNPLVG